MPTQSNGKFMAARKNAEEKIYKLMDELENTHDGFNAENYKKYFSSLSDKEFATFMKRLKDEEWFNLFFEVNMTNKKHTPSMDRIKSILEKYKISMTEVVKFPFKVPAGGDKANPPISNTPVPVIYCMVRPMQQLLDKKADYSSDRDHVNLLTGQVSGDSKSSTFSNQQTIGLCVSNQNDVVAELLGPRADDEVSKEKMLNQIANEGKFDINSISIRTRDKQSLETTRCMMIAAGFRVSFGKETLSYTLPLD